MIVHISERVSKITKVPFNSYVLKVTMRHAMKYSVLHGPVLLQIKGGTEITGILLSGGVSIIDREARGLFLVVNYGTRQSQHAFHIHTYSRAPHNVTMVSRSPLDIYRRLLKKLRRNRSTMSTDEGMQ